MLKSKWQALPYGLWRLWPLTFDQDCGTRHGMTSYGTGLRSNKTVMTYYSLTPLQLWHYCALSHLLTWDSIFHDCRTTHCTVLGKNITILSVLIFFSTTIICSTLQHYESREENASFVWDCFFLCPVVKLHDFFSNRFTYVAIMGK